MNSIIKVLYVDDEPDMLEIGKKLLESEDPTIMVDTIISARLAMKHLNKHKYDVIISDYRMHDMSGIDFLKHLKVSGNTTPVILFTGYGKEKIEIEAFNEGADDYVQKGTDIELQFLELSYKIRRSAINKRLYDENFKNIERFRNVVNSINEYIFEIDIHATITFVSERVKDIMGYEPREMIGKTPLDFLISAEEVQRVSAIFADFGKNQMPVYHMDQQCLSKHGDELTLHVAATAILNDKGIVTGYQGAVEDVTTIRKLEKERKFINLILKTEQETSLDGILIIDEQGKVLSYNQKFITMWGIPDNIIATELDESMLKSITSKLIYPDKFIEHISHLQMHKMEKSREKIYLKDGQIFDQYSAPMIENEKYCGRVWYFREI